MHGHKWETWPTEDQIARGQRFADRAWKIHMFIISVNVRTGCRWPDGMRNYSRGHIRLAPCASKLRPSTEPGPARLATLDRRGRYLEPLVSASEGPDRDEAVERIGSHHAPHRGIQAAFLDRVTIPAAIPLSPDLTRPPRPVRLIVCGSDQAEKWSMSRNSIQEAIIRQWHVSMRRKWCWKARQQSRHAADGQDEAVLHTVPGHGDHVIVINASKVAFRAEKKKARSTIFYRLPGGLVSESLKRVRAERPARLIEMPSSGCSQNQAW